MARVRLAEVRRFEFSLLSILSIPAGIRFDSVEAMEEGEEAGSENSQYILQFALKG